MIAYIIISLIVFHYILLFLLGFLPFKSKLMWSSVVLLNLILQFSMYLMGPWTQIPIYWAYGMHFTFVILLFHSYKKIHKAPFFPKVSLRGLWLPSLLMLFNFWQLSDFPLFFNARNYPLEEAIEFSFPLKNGNFYIAHGGANELMNYHYAYKAQKFALDIKQVDHQGLAAREFPARRLEDFFIFDTQVISPCAGEVLSAVDSHENQTPLELPHEAKNPAGNHIVIYCKGVSVVLAHLNKGSIQVKTGDQITESQEIARAGNSGNTSEPHLHIHAIHGKNSNEQSLIADGKGVPLLFKKQFPVHGDIIHN